jgi:origin recognition complex subunit 1
MYYLTVFLDRLENLVSFEPEAVEFIARKVSAASGDARRALDISRRAAELAEKRGHM